MNLEAEAFILQHLSIYHQHSKENLRPISRFEETFARDCVVFFAERARLPNNHDDLLRAPKLTGPFDVKRSEKIQRLYIRLNEPKAAGFLEFLKINIRPSNVDFVTGIQLTEKFEFQQSSGKFDVRTLESPKV